MKRTFRSALLWLSFAFASPALAVPTFDLIVPKAIYLTETGSDFQGFSNNGGLWIIATTATLTLADFADVEVGIAVDDARISASGNFLNESLWTPLSPGYAVIRTIQNNDYSSLLFAGESVLVSNPFFWQIDFPVYSDVIGQHVMTWNIRVGDQHVSFASLLDLAVGPRFDLTFSGQRVTSRTVAEPASLALISLGLIGLAFARRRKRQSLS